MKSLVLGELRRRLNNLHRLANIAKEEETVKKHMDEYIYMLNLKRIIASPNTANIDIESIALEIKQKGFEEIISLTDMILYARDFMNFDVNKELLENSLPQNEEPPYDDEKNWLEEDEEEEEREGKLWPSKSPRKRFAK